MNAVATVAGGVPASTTTMSIGVPKLLAELDAPLLRHLRIGYVRVGTLNALRAAALIREELKSRGEALL